MPSQDLIDVRIVVDGAPLCELPDVAAPQDERVQTRYVEVKTGQTFSVEVELQEGFEFHTASYVHVSVYFDYNKDPERKAAGYDGIGIILQRPHVIEFSDMRFKDQETGKWYSSAFKFGDLALGEDIAVPQGWCATNVDFLGSIHVVVFRARLQRLNHARVWDGDATHLPDEFPEKCLKGKALKNKITYGEKVDAQAPELLSVEYSPVQGEYGRPYEFIFHYRDRKSLQILGCIPRSPSPPPDSSLILQRTEEMLRLSKEESRERNLRIRDLEARLSRIEAAYRDGIVPGAERAATVAGPETAALTIGSSPHGMSTRDTGQKTSDPGEAGHDQARIKPEPEPNIALSPTSSHRDIRRDGVEDVSRGAPPAQQPGVLTSGGDATEEDPPGGTAAKRARGEDEDEDKDELVEVAPPRQKPKVMIDLTDDD